MRRLSKFDNIETVDLEKKTAVETVSTNSLAKKMRTIRLIEMVETVMKIEAVGSINLDILRRPRRSNC